LSDPQNWAAAQMIKRQIIKRRRANGGPLTQSSLAGSSRQCRRH
jgi:hypothetical protein